MEDIRDDEHMNKMNNDDDTQKRIQTKESSPKIRKKRKI